MAFFTRIEFVLLASFASGIVLFLGKTIYLKLSSKKKSNDIDKNLQESFDSLNVMTAEIQVTPVLPDIVRIKIHKYKDEKPAKTDFFTPTYGRTKIRLLPAIGGKQPSDVIRLQHYFHSMALGTLNFNCIENCIACKSRKYFIDMSKHAKTGKAAQNYKFKSSRCKPNARFYHNILVYNEETQKWSEPQIWTHGIMVQEKIEKVLNHFELFDLNNGHDMFLYKSNNQFQSASSHGIYPQYTFFPASKPRSIENQESVMSSLWDLSKVSNLEMPSEKQIIDSLKQQNLEIPVTTDLQLITVEEFSKMSEEEQNEVADKIRANLRTDPDGLVNNLPPVKSECEDYFHDLLKSF